MVEDEDSPGWQPLHLRDTPAVADFETLVEGNPEWLERSVWRWAMDRAVRIPNLSQKAERLLRIRLPEPQGSKSVLGIYWEAAGDDERLSLLDFFIHDLQDVFREARDQHFPSPLERRDVLIGIEQVALALDELLVEGGSVWTVSIRGPDWALVRRVMHTTQALVD